MSSVCLQQCQPAPDHLTYGHTTAIIFCGVAGLDHPPCHCQADLDSLVSTMGKLCNCQAGPAGAVSSYLAFGTSMDWLWTQLGTPYPLTLELYGSGSEGKLPVGHTNKRLNDWPVEALVKGGTEEGARPLGRHFQGLLRAVGRQLGEPGLGRGTAADMAGDTGAGSQGRASNMEQGTGREGGWPWGRTSVQSPHRTLQQQAQPHNASDDSADDAQLRQLLAELASDTAATDKILSKLKTAPAQAAQCFSWFNPVTEQAYREVVGRWFAILMYTLRHVADPAHPSKATIQPPAGVS